MTCNDMIEKLGGTGPDLLLIHGYGADRMTWQATAPALIRYASVWVIDLPGHGTASRHVGDGSVQTLADLVRQAVEHVGLRELHLVGHSLGGRLAIELACQYPELVLSLSLLTPAFSGSDINSDFLTRFRMAKDPESIDVLLRTLVHEPRMISRGLSQVVLKYLDQTGTRDALQRIEAGLTDVNADIRPRIDQLHQRQIPCMSVWGQHDRINPLDTLDLTSLPGVTHQLERCGHLPHMEQSVIVNRLLTRFHQNLLKSH